MMKEINDRLTSEQNWKLILCNLNYFEKFNKESKYKFIKIFEGYKRNIE